MAGREISSALRNLKFMQRAAALREGKPKEEEEKPKPKPDDRFGALPAPSRKCIVIMEGNPHPGAVKGRMSFQNFNPSVDKLYEEAANIRQMQASNTNCKDGRSFNGGDETSPIGSEHSNVASFRNNDDIELKRKQPEAETEMPTPQNSKQNERGDNNGQSSSQNNARGSYKQQKREKLDWNVLRQPKVQSRRS